ncbi:MAG: phage terminase small subunit [Anaerorhabdus sp.]|uniref:phage terminase small subunit n=1 Tax=Anaerorhabdus sp. TaxID=1872524 RepID=UPI002FC85344
MKKDNREIEVIARELFNNGLKYKDIAIQVGVTESCIKSWATRYWKKEKLQLSNDKKVATKSKYGKGKNPNSRNGTGPPRNQNAVKHGLFSKWLPQETLEIANMLGETECNLNPLDILWQNITLQYAAIIRAQKLMYVKNQEDKTIEKIEEKDGNVCGKRWEVQQAWDKHANFLNSQSRAMSELSKMIRQYDEMLHKNWDMASEEQRERISFMKARTLKLSGVGSEVEDLDETDAIIYGN